MTPIDPNAGSRTGRTKADTRRRFMKKAAYIAPALLTLPTVLSAAQVGSVGVCVLPEGGGDGTIVGGPFDGEVCS